MNTKSNKIKSQKVFMSFNKICYGYEVDASWALEKWLSEPTTLEFIQLWESLHNLDFRKDEFIHLCSKALSVGSAPDLLDLNTLGNVSGIKYKNLTDKEVVLHRDLAIDFASWASPAFRTYCLLQMQNDWNESQQKFVSEEDLIISSKTLAEFTQSNALQNFKSLVNKVVYNYDLFSG